MIRRVSQTADASGCRGGKGEAALSLDDDESSRLPRAANIALPPSPRGPLLFTLLLLLLLLLFIPLPPTPTPPPPLSPLRVLGKPVLAPFLSTGSRLILDDELLASCWLPRLP